MVQYTRSTRTRLAQTAGSRIHLIRHPLARPKPPAPPVPRSREARVRLRVLEYARTHPVRGTGRPFGIARSTCSRWRHRFDLFADERPFYQSYEVLDRYAAPITKLTHELASPVNPVSLFDHTLPGQLLLTPAQAARYLVAHQAFAVGGLVSGVGDEKYADAAPLCKAAVCLAKGESLFRTLMLNLVAYEPEEGKPFEFRGDDRPAWERDQGPKPADRRPDGYLDLLTWQSRRILLLPETRPDGTHVVPGVVIMKGEQFPDDWELWQGETMVPFRKVRDRPPFPLALSEDRALWRDSLALMQTARARVDESLQPPRLIDWLTELVEFGAFDRRTTFPIDIYGLTTDQAAVRFWRHERFPLPAAILDNQQLVSRVKEILDVAESAGETLRQAVRDIARATLPDGSRDAAASPLPPRVDVHPDRMMRGRAVA